MHMPFVLRAARDTLVPDMDRPHGPLPPMVLVLTVLPCVRHDS
ncbi:hypothetical protein ACWD04_10550 [Streptomyces sp. NPDC002911]